MEIRELNEQLDKFILNELRPEDAGDIVEFKDFDDAIDKLKNKYNNDEILAYCPNAISIPWDGKEYQLAVVLGVKEETEGGMKPHGMAHFLDKHTFDNGNEPTQEDLIKAAKNIKSALAQAVKAKPKEHRFVYNPFENKLIFTNGRYVYIVCLQKDKEELTYLHNLFQTKGNNADYIKGRKEELKQQLSKELPPKYDV